VGDAADPETLLEQGVRDMVRVSDARMSGTSYGACVLHVAPESFVGGPLAFVRDGDIIELDVPARRLSLRVSDEELAKRRQSWKPREVAYPRGYGTSVRASRDAGRQGLRLRLPRRHGTHRRSGDSLSASWRAGSSRRP
jgi:dihydroxy-acid dehydratase